MRCTSFKPVETLFHFVKDVCICFYVEVFFVLIVHRIVVFNLRFDVIVITFIIDLVHSKCPFFAHPADVLAKNMFRHVRVSLGDVGHCGRICFTIWSGQRVRNHVAFTL